MITLRPSVENIVDGGPRTEQPVDVDDNYGERESVGSDSVESESGTISTHGNAYWDISSSITETSDDNDNGNSSDGDHSVDYCNPEGNTSDIPLLDGYADGDPCLG